MRFDEKLRKLLEWSGRSLRELADVLSLPPTTVSNWVNSGSRPRRDKMEKVAAWASEEFGIPVEAASLADDDIGLRWRGGEPVFVEKTSKEEPFNGRPRYIRSGFEDVELCELPVLGRVPAGALGDMAEDIIGTHVVPKFWTGGIDGCFVLRLWGDSMSPTLRDGELIVCDRDRAAFPRDGQIVVARHKGEATVKEYLRQDTQVLLVPHNRDYPTVSVRPDELEITAVVVGRWQAMPNV